MKRYKQKRVVCTRYATCYDAAKAYGYTGTRSLDDSEIIALAWLETYGVPVHVRHYLHADCLYMVYVRVK